MTQNTNPATPLASLTIAFDADDTLWHNETLFLEVQNAFRDILHAYSADDAHIDARLHATEHRNLEHFGYGIKGFVLSMIETAIELTEGRVPGSEIQRLVNLGKWMLAHPVEPLPGVAEALTTLAANHPLMLVTKGDLFDQESKLARSGLGVHFAQIEIVSDKTEASYRRILARHGIRPADFVMIGNSLRSDILPVVALGGHAIHVPYESTWAHEHVDGVGPQTHGYREVAHIGEVGAVIEALSLR